MVTAVGLVGPQWRAPIEVIRSKRHPARSWLLPKLGGEPRCYSSLGLELIDARCNPSDQVVPIM